MPLSGCTTIYLSIHQQGYLGFVQVLAAMSKAATTFVCGFCVDVSFQLPWVNRVNTKEHDSWMVW